MKNSDSLLEPKEKKQRQPKGSPVKKRRKSNDFSASDDDENSGSDFGDGDSPVVPKTPARAVSRRAGKMIFRA